MYTDACPSGWAAVIIFPDDIHVLAGPFQRVEDISLLEARAVVYGMRALPFQTADSLVPLEILVDNTTVLFTAISGKNEVL